jgi:hypothetical protein
MQASENTPTRAALAFQLVAALDLYVAQLVELDSSELDESSGHLMDLTETVRNIRLHCAPFSSLSSLFVELLIGHSELVFAIAQNYRTLGPSRRRRRSALVAAQRKRAQDLLRKGAEPLSAGAAANDTAIAKGRST